MVFDIVGIDWDRSRRSMDSYSCVKGKAIIYIVASGHFRKNE